jgi:hypothetical protein
VYNINEGASVELPVYVKGGMQPYSFTWSSESGLDNYTTQIPTASPSLTTTYTVTIADAEGSETVKSITVNVSEIGIDNNTFESLQVYKNSSNELIVTNSQIIDMISIYDVTGKLIFEESISNYNASISIANFPQGMYIINITGGQNQTIKKIMK